MSTDIHTTTDSVDSEESDSNTASSSNNNLGQAQALCLKQFREFLSENSDDVHPEGVCIFIGDIHGQVQKLSELWTKLEKTITSRISRTAWEYATIVFMGDYADKNSNTKDTIDWLSKTLTEISPSTQQRLFLMGNHDHSLMCFLGLIPDAPPTKERMELFEICRYVKMGGSIWCPLTPEDAEIEKTLPSYSQNKKYSAKLSAEKVENIYSSYGCVPPQGNGHGTPVYDELLTKIPPEHFHFLLKLRMVEILRIPARGYAICTHGGIINDMPVLPQINSLLTSPDRDIVPQLSCNMDFSTEAPREAIADDIVFVSGHHKVLHFSPSRIIVDTGNPKGPAPISAVVIPPKSALGKKMEKVEEEKEGEGEKDKKIKKEDEEDKEDNDGYGLSDENICYGLFVVESSG